MLFSGKLRYLFLVAAAAVMTACGDPAAPGGINTGGDTPSGGGTSPSEENPYTPIEPVSTGTWSGTAAIPPVTDGKTIPSYSDDYRPIAPWSQKDKWNLANVHDPSIAYYGGYYYMFNTDASYGNAHLESPDHAHFPGKRSKDLVNWSYVPGPFTKAPDWVYTRLNEIRTRMELDVIGRANISYGFWAPVIRTVKVGSVEKLRMYYCIVIDNYIKSGKKTTEPFDGSWTERAFIGMAETTSPETGNWTDYGFVTCSLSDKGKSGWTRASAARWDDAYFYYNAIDPTYIVADGKHYLIYGSWHSGFALLELDPSTGMPLKDLGDPWADNLSDLTKRFGPRVGARNTTRWQGSEAPETHTSLCGQFNLLLPGGLLPTKALLILLQRVSDLVDRQLRVGNQECRGIVAIEDVIDLLVDVLLQALLVTGIHTVLVLSLHGHARLQQRGANLPLALFLGHSGVLLHRCDVALGGVDLVLDRFSAKLAVDLRVLGGFSRLLAQLVQFNAEGCQSLIPCFWHCNNFLSMVDYLCHTGCSTLPTQAACEAICHSAVNTP